MHIFPNLLLYIYACFSFLFMQVFHRKLIHGSDFSLVSSLPLCTFFLIHVLLKANPQFIHSSLYICTFFFSLHASFSSKANPRFRFFFSFFFTNMHIFPNPQFIHSSLCICTFFFSLHARFSSIANPRFIFFFSFFFTNMHIFPNPCFIES